MVREFDLSISRLKGMTKHLCISELKQIMRRCGISEDNNIAGENRREQLMAKFISTLNTLKEDKEKQNEMIELFNNYFVNMLREKNRIVGISYLGLNYGKLRMKADEFVSEFYEDTYLKNEIFETNPRINKFDKVYHKVISDGEGNIEIFEVLYVIAYRSLKDIEKNPKENHLEYIHVVFDVKMGKAYFYMGYPHNSIGKSIVSTPYSTFNELKKILMEDFKVTFSNSNTGEQVFKIYQMYTEKNESDYVDKLNKIDNKLFQNFYDDVTQKLDSNIRNPDLYINRIKNVFVRAIIDNDFVGFTEAVKKSNGYITGFIYKDLFGGSITGKDGAGRNPDRENNEVNPLQASDTYFDTKDTIYLKQQLFSVKLCLRSKQDIVFRHDVRVSSYPDLLMIHFLKVPVARRNLDYVLQEFRNIV